jgi:lipoprotein-releasing system ATP-binding protein
MSVALLKLVNVRKELSIQSDGETITTVILPGISLEIGRGEFTAITGPSGSGKTTLLYLMGILDKPTSGSVFLEGEEVTRKDEEELAALRNDKLGFVYQFHFLLPEFSSLENVMMPMLARGRYSLSKARERAKELLHLVDMSDRLSNKPNQLSGGQQQRVAIARALVNDPKILLCDEPTGNLDRKTGLQIMDILCDLHRKGKTVIIVTHDPKIAEYAHRTITLEDGRVVGS